MRLKTYRLNVPPTDQRDIIVSLYENILKQDKYWHFFRDEGGVTLRFSPHLHQRMKKFLSDAKVNFSVEKDYIPSMHEYPDIKFLGDDLLDLFHTLSVFSAKYPRNVTLNQVLERMNHALVNQSGIHNFFEEAEIYSKLALRRAELGGIVGRGNN